ncbi:hypothetical protein ACQR3P_29120 [Rhodococcus sp. IEGM1300]
MKANVHIEEDKITITDRFGFEIVMWHEDEWTEDPSVVFSIANAIFIATTEGERALKDILFPEK